MSIESAFAIRIHVELDLANAAIELLWKWLMLIVQSLVGIRILLLPELAFVGSNACVIAIVRPNNLYLVELQSIVRSLSKENTAKANWNDNNRENAAKDRGQWMSFVESSS